MLKIHLGVRLEGLLPYLLDSRFSKVLPEFKVAGFTVNAPQTERLSAIDFGSNCLAETELDLGESTTVNPPVVYETVDALITCFRLFKRGYVGASQVIGNAYVKEGGRPIEFRFGSPLIGPGGGMVYSLNSKEIPMLQEFSAKITPLILSDSRTSRSDLAFRFFNRGVEDLARNDFSIVVVDHISCLEALLTQSNNELAHTLSEAVAVVTEREPANRKKRYKEVKGLYKKRSKALHGEKADADSNDASLAENLARQTLRFCLGYYSKGYNRDKILEDIEDILFGVTKEFPDHAFEYLK